MADDVMIQQRVSSAREPALLDKPISAFLHVNWETVAWLLLLVVAIGSRFYDLGTRAMSHDESLHALYSFYLYDKGEYVHNPMMHGPFLFHANALIYFLFGDNDTTARIVPALAGLATILMAYPFRRYIGRLGALMAGILITISPSLLFHSRYIRNDIYIALFTMLWIYAAFRYLDTRHVKYMTLMTVAMALGLVAKENHFITGAIVGAFFLGLALWQNFVNRETKSLLRNHALDLCWLMGTLILPFLAPFGHLVMGWDPNASATTQDLIRSGALVGIATLLSVAIGYTWFGVLRANADTESNGESESIDASEEVAYQQQPPLSFAGWGRQMMLFWSIEILFFTTFLTNARNGLASGIVGSLGYWVEQQEVARGGQPWFYYPMIGSLYEFLPIVLTLVGIAVMLYHTIRKNDWEPTPVADLPRDVPLPQTGDEGDEGSQGQWALHLRRNRVYMVVFGAWWVIGSWVAYTAAGEKMPWLLTHIALPMCVFGGWYFARLLNRIDWPRAMNSRAVWLIGLTPALIFAGALLVRNLTPLSRTTDAIADRMQAILAILVIAALVYLANRWRLSIGWRSALRLLSIGLVAILAVLTVRFSVLLTYINYDMATEYLIYAHGGPDLKRALDEIDKLSERTVGGRNIVVAYDDDSSWPLSWYMRLYPNSKFYGSTPNNDAMSADVIIVGNKNYDKVHPYVARDYVKRTYRQVWWPDQGYFFFDRTKFIETISSWDKLERVFQIIFYRRHRADGVYVSQDPNAWRDLTQWPQRHDFEMWVRRDIASQIWDLGVAPIQPDPNNICVQSREREVELTAASIYQGIFGNLGLLTPRDVAVGPDGERVVADSGNHRLIILDQGGNEIRTVGNRCNLSEGEAGGCVDPDGDGPLVMGDGQFNEPWGVAVDQNGMIYVSDTWNGRIQVFDSEGNFVTKWGRFGTTDGELGDPHALFGPRGIAVDSGGNLLVADTGNKRIIQFTNEGELVTQIGGGGVIGGRFEEPVGIAVDNSSGSIYIADAWNRRIQKLSSILEFEQEWPVCGWESQQIYHKPYLTVAPNGDVYATDPELSQVYVYDNSGELKAVFGRPGSEPGQFVLPTGLSVDPSSDTLIVADSDNNRIMAFPLLP